MKRASVFGVLVTAMMVLTATGASAKFGIGIRGGLGAGYANYQGSFSALGVTAQTEKKNTGAALAGHIGLAANFGLPAGFEVESGVQFAYIGSREKTTNALGKFTWNRSIYTIQVPLRAGFGYSFGDLVGIYAQLGPQFTIAVGGKDKNTGNVKITSVNTENEMTFGDDATGRFLMDLSIHAGVSLGNFRIGGYYDLGLLNMSRSDNFTYRPSSGGVSLAYFFTF